MAGKNDVMLPQLKALKTTDISPLIRMAGAMLPRVLGSYKDCLDAKQKSAFDRVMPVGSEKKIYLQLLDTPTPPIVIGIAQPLKMSTLPERDVRQQQIKGVRLTVDDVQLITQGFSLGILLRLAWRLKGQTFTILGMAPVFWPFIRLGPAELRDMGAKAKIRFKPLMDLLPRPKR